MRKDGWDVAVSAFFGVQGYPIVSHGEDWDERWKGLTIKQYPQLADPFGSDAMLDHGMRHGANVVISMQDIWPLQPQALQKMRYWIPYLPIDKDPVPENVKSNLRFAYKIITFSKFGQDALEKQGYASRLIVEGTDTEIFKPMPKAQARAELNLPQDAFIWGMIGANKENPPRKGFQEAIQGFKLFSEKHPEARIFFHTQQVAPGGFPIEGFCRHLGIADKMFFVDPYLAAVGSNWEMTKREYSAFDALLHPSQTEGFGLCIIEAQSCGIPVLAQASQSQTELIVPGKTGELCGTLSKRWTNDNSWVNVASPEDVAEKMEKIYEMVKRDPKKVALDCRKHIKENYSIDTLYEQSWRPFLEELQEEILPQTTRQGIAGQVQSS